MIKSYRVDAKAKALKNYGDYEQIPHGDSLISADHMAKCILKSKSSESKFVSKLGLADERKKEK